MPIYGSVAANQDAGTVAEAVRYRARVELLAAVVHDVKLIEERHRRRGRGLNATDDAAVEQFAVFRGDQLLIVEPHVLVVAIWCSCATARPAS